MADPACRRCSECIGENHHWIEHCDDPSEVDEPFVGFVCKHCDARAEMCERCDGANEPGHECDFGEDGPYVCPGCHAVGGERCAPDCIDAEMAREREASERDVDGDDDDEPDCVACEVQSASGHDYDRTHTCEPAPRQSDGTGGGT